MSRLCSTCDQLISEKRLAAVPNATLCIVCKSQDEQPCRQADQGLRLAYTRSQEDTYAVRKMGSGLWSRKGLCTYGLGEASA